MGTFRFSMRMLVKDYKKSLFYGITLIFAVAVCFVFFNIINNPDLADQAIARSGGTWNDVQMPFSSQIISFYQERQQNLLLWLCLVQGTLIQRCMFYIKHLLC